MTIINQSEGIISAPKSVYDIDSRPPNNRLSISISNGQSYKHFTIVIYDLES